MKSATLEFLIPSANIVDTTALIPMFVKISSSEVKSCPCGEKNLDAIPPPQVSATLLRLNWKIVKVQQGLSEVNI